MHHRGCGSGRFRLRRWCLLAGAQVLVIERGNSAGANNVTGGRLYAHSGTHHSRLCGSGPIERMITRNSPL